MVIMILTVWWSYRLCVCVLHNKQYAAQLALYDENRHSKDPHHTLTPVLFIFLKSSKVISHIWALFCPNLCPKIFVHIRWIFSFDCWFWPFIISYKICTTTYSLEKIPIYFSNQIPMWSFGLFFFIFHLLFFLFLNFHCSHFTDLYVVLYGTSVLWMPSLRGQIQTH